MREVRISGVSSLQGDMIDLVLFPCGDTTLTTIQLSVKRAKECLDKQANKGKGYCIIEGTNICPLLNLSLIKKKED